MCDISGKGSLHRDDFEYIAFRATVLETKGKFDINVFNLNVKIMDDFFTEVEKFADFKRGKRVTIDEFVDALKRYCAGKSFKDMPKGIRVFITICFNSIDLNGDGLVGIDEYRLNCNSRRGFNHIKEIDEAYAKLLTDADKKAGGLIQSRYEDLFAQYLANADDKCNGAYMMGPLRAC